MTQMSGVVMLSINNSNGYKCGAIVRYPPTFAFESMHELEIILNCN
jgi:hypothetical protein